MQAVLITSILIRLSAAMWAALVARRIRDWRMTLFAVLLWAACGGPVLGLMLTDSLSAEGAYGWAATVMSMVLSLIMTAAVWAIDSLFRDYSRAESALRTHERHMATVAEHLPGAMYSFVQPADGEGRVEYLGPGIERLLGPDAHAIAQDTEAYLDRVHPEDRDKLLKERERSQATRDAFDVEYRLMTDQGYRAIRSVANPVEERESGTIWYGLLLDNQRNFDAQREIERNRDELQSLLDGMPGMVLYKDRNNNILRVNTRTADGFGVTPEEMANTPAARWFPSLADQCFTEDKVVMETKQPFLNIIVPMEGSNGVTQWLQFDKYPKFDGDGNVEGVTVFVQDVTDRHRANEAIRESEERFRKLFEDSSDILLVHDADGRLLDANGSACEQLGYSRDELLTMGVYDIDVAPPSPDLEEIWRELINGDRIDARTMYGTHRRKDGTTFPVEVQLSVHDMGEATYILASARDITERKAAEAEILNRIEFERLLFKELDHRVRNNLASLESIIELTARSASGVRPFADSIGGRVRAMSVVHDHLSSTNWQPQSMLAVIQAIEPMTAKGRVRLEGPNVSVPAAKVTALGMVMHELFTNSTKYGALSVEDGEVAVSWTIVGEPDDVQVCRVTWQERGGPAIEHLPQSGVGTSLINGIVRTDLRGEVEMGFSAKGVEHRLTLCFDKEADAPFMVSPNGTNGSAKTNGLQSNGAATAPAYARS